MGYTVYITANRYYEVHIKDGMQKIQTMQCSRLWQSMITESSKAMRMSLNLRLRNRRMIDWQASGKPVGYQKLRIVG